MGAAPILTVLKNGETIRSVTIDGESVVGRGEGCVIRLEDRAISRQHAVFRPVGGGVQVERKSEFAPLAVNGAECTHAVLKEGDVVAIGPYSLKLTMPKTVRHEPQTVTEVLKQPEAGVVEDSSYSLAEAVSLQPALASPEPLSFQSPAEIPDSEMPGVLPEFVESAVPAQPLLAEMPVDAPLPGLDLGGGIEGISPALGHESPAMPFSSDGMGAVALEVPVDGGMNQPMGEIQLDQPDMGIGGDSGQLSASHGANQGSNPIRLGETTAPTGTPVSGLRNDDADTRVSAPEKVEAYLFLPTGAANVTELELSKDEISIGRGKDCDIVINDRKVSRKNTTLTRMGARYYIRDLGSANGTYVNGVRIEELPLASDDVIRVGDVEIKFSAMSKDYAKREKNFMPIPEKTPSIGTQPPELEVPAFNYQPSQSSASVSQPFTGGFPNPIQDISSPVTPFGTPVHPTLGVQGAPVGLPGGLSGIAGIGGAGALPPNASLVQKFRALPPLRKGMWTIIILGLLWEGMDTLFPPDVPQQKKPTAAAVAQKKPGETAPSGAQAKTLPAFDALPSDQKKAVEQWHTLAFDHYTNREYDKSLYELRKIFEVVPDYLNSRELERYAKEGKRQLETREEEKRKAEQEARVKSRIAQLIQEIDDKMKKKQFDLARALFAEVLTLDPENAEVTKFSAELESFEERKRIAEQEKEIRSEIALRAKDFYLAGNRLRNQGKYHSAIGEYGKVIEINPDDKKLLANTKAGISAARAAIAELREPTLAEAKQAEEAGELANAYKLYRKATKIDPGHPEGWGAMNRIRGALHERAKALYTEAVLAESYSDFSTAKQKYRECLDTAPEGDIYHQRAQRKLSRYFGKDEAQAL